MPAPPPSVGYVALLHKRAITWYNEHAYPSIQARSTFVVAAAAPIGNVTSKVYFDISIGGEPAGRVVWVCVCVLMCVYI